MNKPNESRWNNSTTNLLVIALLMLAGSASAQFTVTTTNQQGVANTWPYTPTWSVETNNSLIAGMAPTVTNGNFNLETPTTGPRNVNSLTLNTNLMLDKVTFSNGSTTSSNYVTVGNGGGAGNQLVYTLPVAANGYDVTNITVFGGWADNGRDALAFTVLYSTVDNPSSFMVLTRVQYNPTVPNNTPSANQAIISSSPGDVVAANVAAIEFVFDVPAVENGYSGLAAITIGGQPSVSMISPALQVTTATQTGATPFTPSWTVETPDLLAGIEPSASTGDFTLETSAGTNVLTDGIMGTAGDNSTLATCGGGGGSGGSVIYTLTNNLINGSDITNIVVYSGWGDGGRDGQYYNLSYSTVSAPTLFVPITTVYYNPRGTSGGVMNRVAIAMNDGSTIASGVSKIKIDFSGPPSASSFDNGYQGYAEVVVQGQDSATPPLPPSAYLLSDTLPSYATTVVGDQITFTAAYSNTPPVALQWQQVTTSPAATNDISAGVVNVTNNGVVTSTLTLNNLQLTDSGSYRLMGLNATNGTATVVYSTAAPLTVSAPSTVGNIVMSFAEQAGLGPIGPFNDTTNFAPTWTADTANDLILGFGDGGPNSPGSVYAGIGNFGLAGAFGDPAILSDGDSGILIYNPGTGGNSTLDTCGPYNTASGANYPGVSLTYTLDTSSAANGFDLTNIVVYGGWGDSGHNEQKYQVLYSTIGAPNTFIPMTGWVDYAPVDPNGWQSATRSILTPVAGVMAKNVYAVQINFNNQAAPPRGAYSGYSEIIVGGEAAPARPILTQDVTPTTAEDVQGSSLTINATFINATSYQWLKDGTNVPGATSSTLTLNNLQLSDTATNGGYRLVAMSAFGTNTSSACSVLVDPTPTPTNNVITAFAYQTSAAVGFGPTWDVSGLSSSLIYGMSPTAASGASGDFTGGGDKAAGLNILNDGNYGVFASDGTHPAFAAAGPNAGQYVNYSLGSNPDGYTITNIQIAGGWNDNGRDSQYYTVMYSTVANPDMFFPLVAVAKNLASPAYGVGDETVVRTTITGANGILASNVANIYVDFHFPAGVPNGYSGYSEISVFGSPSAAAPSTGPVITVMHEETNNVLNWVAETPNLIAGQLPSSYGSGSFANEGCNVTNLTDGILGFGASYGASCGNDGTAVPWVVFSPANGGGWDLTNIVVYTMWTDYGRDGQFYNLSYSTMDAPTTFVPLTTVAYNPFVTYSVPSGNRVQISPAMGQAMLATNVAAVRFDFNQGSQDFGWSGYTEIVLQGTNLPPVNPPMAPVLAAPYVSGGNLIVTGTGGTPNSAYTWLSTTNLSAPIVWTTNMTGTLDGTGAFSNAIPVSSSTPARFFRLRQP